MEGTIQFLLFL